MAIVPGGSSCITETPAYPAQGVKGDELPPPPPRNPQDEKEFESILLRMQTDLHRALAKPLERRRWVMVIDQRKCVGCHACTISCKAENRLPPGVVYRPVIDEEVGTYPNVRRRFTPRPCMQCDDPPCVPVCPVSGGLVKTEIRL